MPNGLENEAPNDRIEAMYNELHGQIETIDEAGLRRNTLHTPGKLKDPLVNPLRYTSVRDIEQSILRSWFMYKEIPCYVDEILNNQKISISLYEEDYPTRIPINVNSIYFDIRNPPIGYMNQSQSSYTWYGSRLNQRQYRRGLHRGNCEFVLPAPTVEALGPRQVYTVEDMKCLDIVNMLSNIYPTFQDVTKALLKKCKTLDLKKNCEAISLAFNRDMCLCMEFTNDGLGVVPAEMSLYYKNNLLGMFDLETNHVVLLPSYHISFYIRHLIEAGATIRDINHA